MFLKLFIYYSNHFITLYFYSINIDEAERKRERKREEEGNWKSKWIINKVLQVCLIFHFYISLSSFNPFTSHIFFKNFSKRSFSQSFLYFVSYEHLLQVKLALYFGVEYNKRFLFIDHHCNLFC